MARLAVSVTGIKALRRDFERLANKNRKAAQRLVAKNAIDIQRGTRRGAPVDTGRLRSGYEVDIKPDKLSAEVGTNIDYAPHVEFGTRHMRAQPHLGPAFEDGVESFMRDLKRELSRI